MDDPTRAPDGSGPIARRPRSASARARWINPVLPPLAVFLLARALLCLAAVHQGLPPFKSSTWCRGDSGHYLSIAIAGYSLVPCSSEPEAPNPIWCGNAGWLPGYPLLLRIMRMGGIPVRAASVVVSSLFGFATLQLLWIGFLSARPDPFRLASLAMAALFPGYVYDHAAFPLSTFTFLVLLWLHGLERDRWVLGSLAGAVAAFTYAPGVWLAPLSLVWMLLNPPRPGARGRVLPALAASTIVATGFGLVLLMQQFSVGSWRAFFLVQETYGHALGNPLRTLVEHVAPLLAAPFEGIREAPAAQSLLIGFWIVSLSVAAAVRGVGRSPVMLYALAFWVLPLTLGSGLSIYRSEALLLPSVLLADRLPIGLRAVFLVAAAALGWPMAQLFFRGGLV